LGDEEAAVWAAAEAALLARPALAVLHLVRDARAVVESRLGVSAYCGEFIVRGLQLPACASSAARCCARGPRFIS